MLFHRKAPIRRKLVLSLVVLVAALAACEIGMRSWLRFQGTPYSAWRTKEALHRYTVAMHAFVPAGPPEAESSGLREGSALHPYSGLEAWPDTGGVLQYFRERARETNYEIVVMGGSVAASFASTLQNSLPELLESVPELSERRIVVLNYAHAAYKQPQQVMRFAYLLSLGYRPDAVIELDGFNELALAFGNGKSGINPAYPDPVVWGVMAGKYGIDIRRDAAFISQMHATRVRIDEIVESADRWHLWESSLLGRFTLARVAGLDREFMAAQMRLVAQSPAPTPRAARQLSGPPYDARDEEILQSCVRCWVESSITLHDVCAARGIRYVQILQPALHDAGAKPMHAAEKALAPPPEAWLVGVRDGYPLLRARLGELRARGVRILDESRVFADVEAPLYVDDCHLNAEGERLWYERLAPRLREALAGP